MKITYGQLVGRPARHNTAWPQCGTAQYCLSVPYHVGIASWNGSGPEHGRVIPWPDTSSIKQYNVNSFSIYHNHILHISQFHKHEETQHNYKEFKYYFELFVLLPHSITLLVK